MRGMKRRLVAMGVGALLLATAGFAAASIALGGSFASLVTGTTDTTPTGTTGTTPGQRKVTLCHRTHSRKHPFVTITVASAAVPAHLRHGDTLGACTTGGAKVHGRPGSTQPASGSTTDASGTGTGQTAGNGNGNGKAGGEHGNGGSHGNGKGHGKP